jgi:hypothetical protein
MVERIAQSGDSFLSMCSPVLTQVLAERIWQLCKALVHCGWVVCFPSEQVRILMALSDSPAPAAFLVSLYVKDMWLGAQQPDTFLAHIRMVCEAAKDVPLDEPEAIVVLCRNVDSSAQCLTRSR